MTSQYVTEPPTAGLVELITSKGPITIELFSRECPQACRNFLTLALEGFYDNLEFHRLIPGFVIQSGDPSNTGTGGESIYGQPFPIEPHSRLKFNRRGLLAMAALDKQNESQFFLTLDATPELQAKHTLMGRVAGKTIYNLVELSEGVELLDGKDRPRYPPKLLEVRVLEDPFGDLKPRLTKEERRDRERTERHERAKRKEDEESRRKGKGKKNTKLLSFGEEENGEQVALKGPKSSHDLLKDDKRLSKKAMGTKMESKEQDQDLLVEAERKVSPGPSTAITQPPIKNEETPEKRAEHELRRSEQNQESDSFRAKPSSSTSSSFGRDYLSLQRAKYASSSAAKKDSYDALLNFQSRIRTKATRSSSSQPTASTIASLAAEKDDDDDDEEEEEEEEAREYGASDDDADADWRQHKLDAGGRPLGGADGKDRIDDYEVLDPRDHKSNTNGKGKGKGTDGQKGENRREGKRGRDWVDNDRRYSSYDKKGRRQDHVGDRAYKPSSSDDGRDKKYKARQSTDTHDRDRRNRVDHRR